MKSLICVSDIEEELDVAVRTIKDAEEDAQAAVCISVKNLYMYNTVNLGNSECIRDCIIEK